MLHQVGTGLVGSVVIPFTLRASLFLLLTPVRTGVEAGLSSWSVAASGAGGKKWLQCKGCFASYEWYGPSLKNISFLFLEFGSLENEKDIFFSF